MGRNVISNSFLINLTRCPCNKTFILLFLVLLIGGCTTNAFFVRDRDYDVGRNVGVVYGVLTKIIPYTENQDKYLFEANKGRCQWVCYVNKKTKIVESWEYISSPDKCKSGIDWLSPW